MAEDRKYDNEVFIDADSGFGNEKDSYETIILNQINACVKVLSREMTGGQVMYKETKTGNEKYMEDVRELVINHVDTLRMVLCTYITGSNKQQLDTVKQEIVDYKNKIGENKILVPGKGEISVANFKGMHADHPYMKDFTNFKAMKYREIFEILVACYNEKKADIRKLEEE
jgi:hypothetical protein